MGTIAKKMTQRLKRSDNLIESEQSVIRCRDNWNIVERENSFSRLHSMGWLFKRAEFVPRIIDDNHVYIVPLVSSRPRVVQ